MTSKTVVVKLHWPVVIDHFIASAKRTFEKVRFDEGSLPHTSWSFL